MDLALLLDELSKTLDDVVMASARLGLLISTLRGSATDGGGGRPNLRVIRTEPHD